MQNQEKRQIGEQEQAREPIAPPPEPIALPSEPVTPPSEPLTPPAEPIAKLEQMNGAAERVDSR